LANGKSDIELETIMSNHRNRAVLGIAVFEHGRVLKATDRKGREAKRGGESRTRAEKYLDAVKKKESTRVTKEGK